jgi:hypothetical protein
MLDVEKEARELRGYRAGDFFSSPVLQNRLFDFLETVGFRLNRHGCRDCIGRAYVKLHTMYTKKDIKMEGKYTLKKTMKSYRPGGWSITITQDMPVNEQDYHAKKAIKENPARLQNFDFWPDAKEVELKEGDEVFVFEDGQLQKIEDDKPKKRVKNQM